MLTEKEKIFNEKMTQNKRLQDEVQKAEMDIHRQLSAANQEFNINKASIINASYQRLKDINSNPNGQGLFRDQVKAEIEKQKKIYLETKNVAALDQAIHVACEGARTFGQH